MKSSKKLERTNETLATIIGSTPVVVDPKAYELSTNTDVFTLNAFIPVSVITKAVSPPGQGNKSGGLHQPQKRKHSKQQSCLLTTTCKPKEERSTRW